MNTAIDMFCHCLTPDYVDAVDRLAVRHPWMFERARHIPGMVDVEVRLKLMDSFPGYQQIPSLALPPIESLVEADRAPELARIGNDSMAKLVAAHPDRMPGFVASLPMNNVEAALAEASRVVSDLGAVGVQIYSNVNGRPLDQPEYLELFGLMAELGRPVWLHPYRTLDVPDYRMEDLSKFDLWWSLGWPYETSLAMARLTFSGIFDRWPDLAIVAHHCGGVVPMLEGRLDVGMDQLSKRNPPSLADLVESPLIERPIDAFHRFFADTASFGSRASIQCAYSFFGIEKMVFATDMPFDGEGGSRHISETLSAIQELELSDSDLQKLLCGNARRLLKMELANVER